MKTKGIDLLGGNPQILSLEHRVFNLLLFISIFLALLSSILNLFLHLRSVMTIIPLALAGVLSYFYYLSRIKRQFRIPVFLTVLIMLVFAPAIWIANGGSMGGTQYFLVLIAILVAIVYTGRTRYLLLALFLLTLSALIVFEYLHPEAIQYYTSRSDRFIDVLLGFNFAAITMMIIFIVFADSYRIEHQRVREYSKHLEEVAVTDGLTGLYNHSFICRRLEDEVGKARRYNRKLSLIMFDIDHFKKLNDTQGHQYGDYILSKIAEILKENTRASDEIGRYGGEEFLVLCTETGLAEAYLLANRLRTEIERSSFRRDVKVTISGGVAELKEESGAQLVDRADRCLYSAKRLGRNRIGMQ